MPNGVFLDVTRTKIFISSVNEDGLKPLRKNVFRELTGLGHEPVMWEENLGPWPAGSDPIAKCLEAVEACDIYCLFIGGKAGSYDSTAERTVTHLEFIQAYEQRKTILVFGDTEVKSVFFGRVKPLIEPWIERFIAKEERFPAPEHIMNLLSADGSLPARIEPYVWYLMYDITKRGIFVDDLSLGVPIDWRGYFSDLLRRGSLLLPLEESIEQNSERLEQFDEAFELVSGLLPHLRIEGLRQPQLFMRDVMLSMTGGMIEHHYGQYISEQVGYYEDCNAATLYVRADDRLRKVAEWGETTAAPYYALDNQSSYTVLTYHLGNQQEQVFFTEAKSMFYYCIRSGEHVLTFHFPADPSWNYRKFIRYKESANHAIMSKNPFMIQIIKLCLGGMPS
ncbi:DUF4062 domain-containing protein [Paenibacillus macerans]|uniref:DUF4062 domain-containing protein n=1 Tax=Paenibacillus macerans TaxID=44252 RepID=UPI003D314FCC